jgi:hypothetical protein
MRLPPDILHGLRFVNPANEGSRRPVLDQGLRSMNADGVWFRPFRDGRRILSFERAEPGEEARSTRVDRTAIRLEIIHF